MHMLCMVQASRGQQKIKMHSKYYAVAFNEQNIWPTHT